MYVPSPFLINSFSSFLLIDSCEATNLRFPKFSDLAESRCRVASDRGWLFPAASWL